jgi:regulator of protease activity HflC (stomatin/prohibitin superfamily)
MSDYYERLKESERLQREKEKAMAKRVIAYGVAGFVGLAGLGVLLGSWYRVDEGERAVVLTNGSFSEVSGPGLHFKIPFFQTARFITVRNESYRYEQVAAYSYDQQTAELVLSVNYQINPADVENIYRQYGSTENAANRVLHPRVYEQVKNVFGQYTAQRAIQERGQMTMDITKNLQEALAGSGLQVLSVQVENIDYTDAYEQAVEAAAKAKADIERSKSELLRVEQEAQQKVKQAEAEAAAKKLQADADAYATEAAGKATANAIRARGEALKDNPQLVDLVSAERWDGKLPTSMIPGGAVPFINLSDKSMVK